MRIKKAKSLCSFEKIPGRNGPMVLNALRDGNDILIKFLLRHGQGELTMRYSPDEEVAWPIRKDREVKDWIGRFPRAEQLAVGDLLTSPYDDSLPWADDQDYWEELTEEQKEAEIAHHSKVVRGDNRLGKKTFQIVRMISSAGLLDGYGGTIHTIEADSKIEHQWSIGSAEVANRPLDFTKERDWVERTDEKKKKTSASDYPTFGPYRFQDTDRIAYFAEHPHGGGRWNNDIPVYDVTGEGVMRPPRTSIKRSQYNKQPLREEWSNWKLLPGGKRHPRDGRAKGE